MLDVGMLCHMIIVVLSCSEKFENEVHFKELDRFVRSHCL